ncbi:Eco57I restriction-modification methylase [Neolewinella xylanilytica]|uniref:site-specific DNA-methyltransferase (adenine-specific) n=1 Tax=Neolewinella xylanilytica TaxID=1514080 RepID=A0A2S6I8D7_9BACT|nr:Eco57I restriction-modification methylase domain-containing protein [Neolewinella xylanilytica]PPK87755.1 Eco57I restriction-modification methylase [Neolewinella xylanilytica]
MTFLRQVWYREADCLVATKGRIDAVIHDGPKAKDPVGVMIEAKRARNSAEMWHPRPGAQTNKALLELVLYFVRERESGNVGIKSLVITDGDQTYLFADRDFERLFWEKKRFRKRLLEIDADPGKTNALAYEHVAAHLAELDDELPCTALKLSDYRKWCEDGREDTDDKLTPLYKLLGPVHLLRRPFANDSNKLDKRFYRELLHIIGLEEVSVDGKGQVKKSGGKKIIRRLPPGERHPASLLENVIDMAGTDKRWRQVPDFPTYGSDQAEREFAVSLELCITWINRILFLKLLESQLVSYHQPSGEPAPATMRSYKFLTPKLIPDFDGLHTLFFKVLAVKPAERQPIVRQFAHVPYLNSSLFEATELEERLLYVHALKDQFELPYHAQTVLRARGRDHTLHYLFAFLDAYDFGGGGGAIQEENKPLINASVLGLIFEKINGYRDGSFYTPGFITEYMCRETIRRATVQKFRDADGPFADFDSDDFGDLASFLGRKYKADEVEAANAVVNSITVCDPAVGSGHFLVSALNELIAVKAELGILGGGSAGATFNRDIQASVENDELLLTYRSDGRPFEYRVREDSHGRLQVDDTVQLVQRTLFQEKRTLIENCLFGVDINPNSVKICRLRLWIELLKHAYYGVNERRTELVNGQPIHSSTNSPIQSLETLPNIDINIKQGNSLVSRFALDDDLKGALAESDRFTLDSYRVAVATYHRATGPDEKRELLELIDAIKGNFQSHIGRNDKRVVALSKARGKLQQLEGLLEVGDLFGSVDEKKVRKEIKPLKAKVDKLQTEIEGVKNNAIYRDAFEWRFEFPAVLGADGEFLGFDVVVVNPPYIRQEELGDQKEYLQSRFKVYSGTADLLVYFIELGMNNLRPGGQFSFIISNKFMRAGFGKTLRKHLGDYRIVELIDFGDLQVFDGATTYPVIISMENRAPERTFRAMNVPELDPSRFRDQLHEHQFDSLQAELTEDGWNLADVKTQRLLEKLRNTGVPLGEYVNGEIYYGIKTGYNEAFVIDLATRDRLIAEDPKGAEVIKPFLAGRDVKRYVPPVADKYLILFEKGWTYAHGDPKISEQDGFALLQQEYPAVAGWLSEYEERAKQRYDQGDFWWELRACDYYDKFKSEKIIYQIFQVKPVFTFDSSEFYSNNATYIASNVDHKLLGILNSKLGWFQIQMFCTSIQNGYQLIFKYFERLQIPMSNADNLSKKVQEVLTQKSQDPQADTTALEAEIDVLVYRLYGLTYAEVLVVDPGFGMSEEEYLAPEQEVENEGHGE